MDEQKAIGVLKEIFGQYGFEILEDNRRFEATLKDLFGKSFRSPECLALCHALDSDALFFLVKVPTVTKAAAERAAERLEKECRLRSDDAAFAVRCIVAAKGGDVDVLPPRARPRTQAKRLQAVLFRAALISLLGICTVFCYTRIIFYKDLYLSESAQLERKLEDVQKQLSNADTALNTVQERLYMLGRGEYGYASESFYADRGVLTLNPNNTESFSLYGAYESPITYSMRISDTSGLQADWGEEWDGNFVDVIVTARAPGNYTLKFTNSKNSETFDVLIVVPDM